MPNLIDNIIIQVRARLQQQQIKLWLEPFYYQEIGVVESELEKLAEEFSGNLSISVSNCKLALSELQDGALRKLASRKEFEETGLATFSVRRVSNNEGTENVFEVKCALSDLGEELQQRIAEKLQLSDASSIKIISAGKIVNPKVVLELQGIKNNQQLMTIIGGVDNNSQNTQDAMYDRIKKIKEDVEAIVSSGNRLFEMEDQDGNPVFLPPNENKALLMAMGYCEKARSAIKRNQYDEALILLLEADEKFITCNSKFLESVDNYALVNLDIVWCYLCLKNLTQLPDAQRRLEICEKSFHRSYGKDLSRLINLKGDSCPERALIMRLHLLQGVLLFHQNRRNEAYEKLDLAQSELSKLKVDDSTVDQLVEMGFDAVESRIGLRACKGDLCQAISFIQDRKNKIAEARKKSRKERKLNAKLDHSSKSESESENWVNPRSVCSLVEMGFPQELVVVALKKSDNDLTKALDMLQSNTEALIEALPTTPQTVDETLFDELKKMGFDEKTVRLALESTMNNSEKAMEFLLKTFENQNELSATIQQLVNATSGASTSTGAVSGESSIVGKFLKKAQREIDSMSAYNRFNEDISPNENEYLDLPLVQEEQILAEYKRFLEQ
ncbi:NEDD8 ultimate buster 1 [Episyrphus balteatus]|uniref:NEDD8 ultimate buster 1 n=1 Tax=Episyrphus balteatus TaxID=286459 RepID=UPI0024859EBC|nr:NEDD8 ultimate buster 1 [Episyrphus balteatus]